jgi:hypothetical protein
MAKKRPCQICRRWFGPDARVGERQRACSRRACQAKRRARTQAAWRARNPDYFRARRILERQRGEAEGAVAPPPRAPAPLDRLPWDLAQDEFGIQGAEFLAGFGRVLLAHAQDAMRLQPLDSP